MDVGSNRKGPKSEINVTPLVDVVLVLLIIFMVLTPSMLKHLTATVPKKPDEAAASPMPDQSTILVEYTAKRELTVNGEAVAPEGLAAKLAERLRGSRKKVVFFRAEDGALYGEVVRLMDFARGAGAESLAIITDKMQ
jgi:biopolymer transport protein ExbD